MIVPYICFNICCCPFNLNTKTARFEQKLWLLMDRPIGIEMPPTQFAYKLKIPIITRMFKARNSMAPKSSKKRSIQMCKARENKRRNCDDEESDDLDDEIPTFSEDEDETFNPAIEKLDEDAAMEIHVG